MLSSEAPPAVLLVAATTGYQVQAFDEAAERLGVELLHATDHCRRLDDPWGDRAIAVRFDDPAASIEAVRQACAGRRLTGVLGLGDRPAAVAAAVGESLGLSFHPYAAVRAATSKLHTRGRLMAAGLPVPWFVSLPAGGSLASVAERLRFPCVVKPIALSGSRGVIRANDADELEQAVARVRRLVDSPEVAPRVCRDAHGAEVLIEGFIPGREYAVEAVAENGSLRVFAIFEKPEPLDGPFFEERTYVTPPRLSPEMQRTVAGAIAHAARALGLWHGPIHAECRINRQGVFVLEVAPRPIGGLCARALRFVSRTSTAVSLEELLLRHASGQQLSGFAREAGASGVMMIPIRGEGHYRRVEGIEAARAVGGIEDVIVTAVPGQLMQPLPEGGSYLGFIFARHPHVEEAIAALQAANGHLAFRFDKHVTLAIR